MDAPDIPDHRPHKAPSVLSYEPTIVLDDCEPDYPERQDQDLDVRPKPVRTQSHPAQQDQELPVRPKASRTQSHHNGDREPIEGDLNGELPSRETLTPMRLDGEQW